MTREYRDSQKSALVALETLRLEGITFSHANFVAAFEGREAEFLKQRAETIDLVFAKLNQRLGERKTDELLNDLAARLNEHRVNQRLISVEATCGIRRWIATSSCWLKRLCGV